jgi:galactokinase
VHWRPLLDHLEQSERVDRSAVLCVQAPLRICPLGAHVDHQGGVVTGMTLDRYVRLAAVPTSDARVRIESLEFPGETEVDLEAGISPRTGEWGDYLRAAIAALREEHDLRTGLRGIVSGELPAAGLSSSSAVLVAYLLALAEVHRLELSSHELVGLAQRAENRYVGVASGRLDPAVILFAEESCLTRIDCADFSVDQIPPSRSTPAFRVLVAFSGVSRALAATGYNSRVEECREAARRLLAMNGGEVPGSPRLADVDAELFDREAHRLPGPLRRRAGHFFSEAKRVSEGIEAWRSGELERFGRSMTESGESSIVQYECGTPPLVALWELLRDADGVYGTRFSGAGFGGSCLALVDPSAGTEVIRSVSRAYRERYPELASTAGFHVCATDGPARLLPAESLCRE